MWGHAGAVTACQHVYIKGGEKKCTMQTNAFLFCGNSKLHLFLAHKQSNKLCVLTRSCCMLQESGTIANFSGTNLALFIPTVYWVFTGVNAAATKLNMWTCIEIAGECTLCTLPLVRLDISVMWCWKLAFLAYHRIHLCALLHAGSQCLVSVQNIINVRVLTFHPTIRYRDCVYIV